MCYSSSLYLGCCSFAYFFFLFLFRIIYEGKHTHRFMHIRMWNERKRVFINTYVCSIHLWSVVLDDPTYIQIRVHMYMWIIYIEHTYAYTMSTFSIVPFVWLHYSFQHTDKSHANWRWNQHYKKIIIKSSNNFLNTIHFGERTRKGVWNSQQIGEKSNQIKMFKKRNE